MDNESRANEILRRLAERRAAAPQLERQETLSRILDEVDAIGHLEMLQNSQALRRTTYGPRSVRGITPASWVGAVLWRHGTGYHGYKHLHIIGVWALDDNDAVQVVVGVKLLAYTAPTYDAEAYHKLIRRAFDLYYSDDGSPPLPAQRRLSVTYESEARLALRTEISEHLKAVVAALA